jgi:hypothetical protein
MNKKKFLLLSGLGICSVLLVAMAILSVNYDSSSFMSSSGFLGETRMTTRALLTTTKQTTANNLTFIKTQLDASIDTYLPPSSPRLDAHIFTDKVIYRPSDVMFVEVLVLDAFNKTPIALTSKDINNYIYYLLFEVYDPSG